MSGTFRHSSCRCVADSSTFQNDTCFNCAQIPNCKSFRKRILQWTGNCENESHTSGLNFQYMSMEESMENMRKVREELDQKNCACEVSQKN